MQERADDDKKLDDLEAQLKGMKDVSISGIFKQLGLLVAIAIRGHMAMKVNMYKHRHFYREALDKIMENRALIEKLTGERYDETKNEIKNYLVFAQGSQLARAMNSPDDVEPIVITLTLKQGDEEGVQPTIDAVIIGRIKESAVDGDDSSGKNILRRLLPEALQQRKEATLESISLLIQNEQTHQQKDIPLYHADVPKQHTYHTEQLEIIEDTTSSSSSSSSSKKSRPQDNITQEIELQDYTDKTNERK
eukprot:gene15313-18142_t